MRMGLGLGLSRGRPGFRIASLFRGGRAGDYWLNYKDWIFTRSAGGVYEPVTTSGDQIARFTGSINGINADQDVVESRPLWGESGSFSYFDTDNVDDGLDIALQLNGSRWSFAMSYVPDGSNFVLLSRKDESTPWIGVGQIDSTSTALTSSLITQNGIYFDNVQDTSGTRGGQYSAAQSANRVLVDFDVNISWLPVRIGKFHGGAFDVPGRVYSFLLIDRELTESERQNVDTFLARRMP